MYKILIADDEIFVRMGLKMSIDWKENGFELVGEASNGEQALEMMRSILPDIVITDIKMPKMDGIQLIKEISAAYPSVKCLVLSNYDEFELVKEAMKFGAVDYFLKVTIESDKLLEALKQVCGKLDNERSVTSRMTEMKRTLSEHRTVIERQLFLDLIKPEPKPGAFQAAIDALELKLYGSRGHILLLMLRDYESLLETRFHSDRRLLEFTILNVVDELINHQSGGKIIEHSPGIYAMIVSWKEQTDERAVHGLADRIRTTLHDYLSMESNVVCGLAFNDYGQLREGLSMLDKARLAAFYEETGSVVSLAQTNFSGEGVHDIYRNAKNQIALYIQLGDGPRVVSCLGDFLDSLKENRTDPSLTKRYVLTIAGFIQDELILQSEQSAGDGVIDMDIAGEVDGSGSFAELKEVCGSFALQCASLFRSFGQQSPRDEVVKVIHFVKHHFHERISLESMAKHVSMNKSYFSRLFKQETGEAFQDFLIKTRMEEARKLLLGTGKKISEIAAEVGYNDIFYFNRAFKQYFKTSPGEYKKAHRPSPPK